jgi:transcriptional regulator with XRE-family HTH domain
MAGSTTTRRVVWMKLHPQGQQRLRGALMLRNMTHRQLAQQIGWKSHGMIAQLLKGTRTSVTADSAVLISKTLGIPLHDLFLTESAEISGRTSSAAKKVTA